MQSSQNSAFIQGNQRSNLMELATIVELISIVTGIGGLVTGSISLVITLRERRRNVKVALKWGIDTTYQKTSGIGLWINAVNDGYQPVVIHNAGLHVTGVAALLIAAKPLSNKQFPLRLEPGDQFSTLISSEVLIEAFRPSNFQGKINVRGYIQSVFGEFQSSKTNLDIKKMEALVALVKGNTRYDEYRDSMRSMGSIIMQSFTDVEQWLQNIVKGSLEIKASQKNGDDTTRGLPSP
jgi:hypothetical protein